MTETIHIAFAVDRAYFDQVAVTIASIVANAARPGSLRFHVVHAEDEAWAAETVARWAVPHVETVRAENPYVGTNPANTHVSAATLLKTLLPLALPQLDRVIYLDADIVVLRDIGELWRVDLGGAAMAGVIDFGIYRRLVRGEARGNHTFRDYLLSLHLDPSKFQYVNTGLLVMDLEGLRRMDFARRACEMEESRRPTLRFVDQDIINGLLPGQIALLDPRWNVLAKGMSRRERRHHHYIPSMLQDDFALQKAEQWAVHYIGRKKPWNSDDVWHADAWWLYAPLTSIPWQRPPALNRTATATVLDALLDIRSKLSALRFRVAKQGIRFS